MNNEKQDTHSGSNHNHYNSIDAVEQVYSAETIDSAEPVNNMSLFSDQTLFDPQQAAANDAFANADIYSLNSARMAKHGRSLERRSNKSQLTDRRSATRLCADGEIQKDRRADNRAANVESIRLSNQRDTSQN